MHPVDAMCKWKHEKILDIDGAMVIRRYASICYVIDEYDVVDDDVTA